MTTIERVGVAGGGLMGSGIAQVSAMGGCPTVLRELDEALCANARMRIERSMAKAIEKGRLTREDRDAALGRLSFATTLDALGDVDIIIEAVIEKLDAKRALWQSLETRKADVGASHVARLHPKTRLRDRQHAAGKLRGKHLQGPRGGALQHRPGSTELRTVTRTHECLTGAAADDAPLVSADGRQGAERALRCSTD